MNKINSFDIFRCVSCHSGLKNGGTQFICKNCDAIYPMVNSKTVLFITDENELRANYIERPVFANPSAILWQ